MSPNPPNGTEEPALEDPWGGLFAALKPNEPYYYDAPLTTGSGYHVIWSECDNCHSREPMLATFLGFNDWEADMHHPAEFRARIKHLRRRLGKLTINLCDACWELFDTPAHTEKKGTEDAQPSLF